MNSPGLPFTVKPKARKCRICKSKFTPMRPMQPTCGAYHCQVTYADAAAEKLAMKRAKAERQEIRERKEALKPLQYWLKRAEKAFNAWVLVRDREQPCISCGRWEAQAFHAGHHVSVGASSALRFDPMNVHKQCNQCNIHLGGNQAEYAIRLPARIGKENAARLQNAPRARKWTREDCQAIEAEYKAKLKDLTK